MKKKSIAIFMTCGLISVFASSSFAADKFKQTLVAKTDFQTADWNGGKVTIGTIKGVVETYGSTGPSMPNGSSMQSCLLRSQRMKDSIEVVANCSYTDKDGDILYSIAERKQGDVATGSGGKGRTRFMGGTGKYSGATGGCDYLTKYMPDNWSVVESECTRD